MLWSIGTDMPKQSGKTQIRLCRILHLISGYTVCHSSGNIGWKRLDEALPMRTRSICFCGEIRKNVNNFLLKSASSETSEKINDFHQILPSLTDIDIL